MIKTVLIVGGGTAGLISAITLKKLNPSLDVGLVCSQKISHIMVGEGTVGSTPAFLHRCLGIPVEDFYRKVNPTWKLGIRFLWGRRPFFDYTFEPDYLLGHLPGSQWPIGYHCSEPRGMEHVSLSSSLMTANNLFPVGNDRLADLKQPFGYHFENDAIVSYLEDFAISCGVQINRQTIVNVETDESGVKQLIYESGETRRADLYIDASGFKGMLIHEALGVPHLSFGDVLFCNKAVVGGWERRPDERIKPYTTAETMDAGWCWQIEHERVVNRGYVYCSDVISDDQAAEEFRRKNPRIDSVRLVPFESRRVVRHWEKNVIAIGNAAGFVEPLEATNIQVIAESISVAAQILQLTECNPGKAYVDLYNLKMKGIWESVRDFLALHYKYNDRIDTPFWEMARNETSLGHRQALVDHFKSTGPNLLASKELLPATDLFGMSGYLAMLLGMSVPYEDSGISVQVDAGKLRTYRRDNVMTAMASLGTEQAFKGLRAGQLQYSDLMR